MITTDLKELIRCHIDQCWHQGDMNHGRAHCAEGFVYHDPSTHSLNSLQEYLDYIMAVRTAFPDLHFTVLDMVGEQDNVVMRWEFSGTQRAPIRGIPATGNQVRFSGMTQYTARDGKIAEAWTNWDTYGYMQQLGVLGAHRLERGNWTMEATE